MKDYTIKVPCKRYIKKYLNTIHGEHLKPNFKDDFGDSVITKLSSKPLVRISNSELNVYLRDLNDILCIKLPIDFFYRIDNKITNQHIYTLNRFFENTFKDDLYIFVNVSAAFGVQRAVAIESFCNRHGIILETDITLNGLVRMEIRYREEKKRQKDFLVGLSTVFQNHISSVIN